MPLVCDQVKKEHQSFACLIYVLLLGGWLTAVIIMTKEAFDKRRHLPASIQGTQDNKWPFPNLVRLMYLR